MVLDCGSRIGSCQGKVVLREINGSNENEGTRCFPSLGRNTGLSLADPDERYFCELC